MNNKKNFTDFIRVLLGLFLIFYLEIIIGLFLIFKKWFGFILIVLFPLSVAFLIFNFSNVELNFLWTALLVATLNIILIILEKDRFTSLFK